MIEKILISIIALLIIFGGVIIFINNQEVTKMGDDRVYQGPVPEGYDEEHFRKTGITRPLEDKEING